MGSSQTLALSATGIDVTLGRRHILHDVSLPPLPAGSVTALLGPNGSGKSTLLRTLAGLVSGRGEVTFGGEVLHRCTGRTPARDVVYLPQALPAGVHLRVLESVLAAGHGARRAARDSVSATAPTPAVVMALLTQLGIEALAMRFLDELSGGQRQLVGLAQALIRAPRILLLDEPLSALDLHHQFQVMRLIARETVARQMITVVVMHDLSIAMRHANAAVMLRDGRVVAAGDVGDVVTADAIARVFDVQARVERCSRGLPQLIVDDVVTPV
ncbi:ABC transporter ATP-binding protein [Pandoraea commovens]|uniref:ABC transporter ATP-binding protein n=1 Tax=Pandoraea commovens TaxID=2508289 RepID=A0ABY5QP58_9BURK|nr:ABC transporter ATP-binding protein [Pandoraea commovens]UVA82143.1 ABC transporter ATP-binding protein [Pandoraea commovens]